jgi:hypothetical protein
MTSSHDDARRRPPMRSTVRSSSTPGQERTTGEQILDELRSIHHELVEDRRLLNDFASAFLRAKFPYGKPTDRWGTGRGPR